MKVPFWKVALCALGVALSGAATSATTVIGFDDLAPGFSLPGDTVVAKDGYELKMTFGIGVVDGADAFGPGTGLDLALPVGTSGQFLTLLNDGRFTITRPDGSAFGIQGFEAGFVSPLATLFAANEYAGSMGVFYEDANGVQNTLVLFDAIANQDGEFAMRTVFNVPQLMNNLVFASFFFLTPDGSGSIVWPNQNFNQFVIDNIGFMVPVPGTLVLALLPLGLLGAVRTWRGV